MKVVQLGKNIFEIRLPFFYGNARKHLVAGLTKIQDDYGKTILSICNVRGFSDSYLVITRGSENGKD